MLIPENKKWAKELLTEATIKDIEKWGKKFGVIWVDKADASPKANNPNIVIFFDPDKENYKKDMNDFAKFLKGKKVKVTDVSTKPDKVDGAVFIVVEL